MLGKSAVDYGGLTIVGVLPRVTELLLDFAASSLPHPSMDPAGLEERSLLIKTNRCSSLNVSLDPVSCSR